MNIANIKKIGKVMMIVGGCVFGSGVGLYSIAAGIEWRGIKEINAKKKLEAETAKAIEKQDLDIAATKARIEKVRAYSDQVARMDRETFAKFHAEKTAKANQDVLDKANAMRRKCDADIVKARLECTESKEKLRAECLTKITEANAQRDEAIRKYDAINLLFTNKDDILKAKAELEKMKLASEQNAKDREKIIKELESLLS